MAPVCDNGQMSSIPWLLNTDFEHLMAESNLLIYAPRGFRLEEVDDTAPELIPKQATIAPAVS